MTDLELIRSLLEKRKIEFETSVSSYEDESSKVKRTTITVHDRYTPQLSQLVFNGKDELSKIIGTDLEEL